MNRLESIANGVFLTQMDGALPLSLTTQCQKPGVDFPGQYTSVDIPQMTSKFGRIVPPFHRQENCIPFAAIRGPYFGDRPALGIAQNSRHSDTPLRSFSPRRRCPRPTPERVLVADHQSGSGFSGTFPSAPPARQAGTYRSCTRPTCITAVKTLANSGPSTHSQNRTFRSALRYMGAPAVSALPSIGVRSNLKSGIVRGGRSASQRAMKNLDPTFSPFRNSPQSVSGYARLSPRPRNRG